MLSLYLRHHQLFFLNSFGQTFSIDVGIVFDAFYLHFPEMTILCSTSNYRNPDLQDFEYLKGLFLYTHSVQFLCILLRKSWHILLHRIQSFLLFQTAIWVALHLERTTEMTAHIVFAVPCLWEGGTHSLQALPSILLIKHWLCTQPIEEGENAAERDKNIKCSAIWVGRVLNYHS